MRTDPFLLAALVLSACAAAPVPAPAGLGNRIRVTVEGRGHEPSITTADYWLLFVVRDANGRRLSIGVWAPKYSESEGTALSLGKTIESALGTPPVDIVETQQGNSPQAEDAVLPPGVSLCFEPGCHYAYRVDDRSRQRVADLAPEIRIAMTTADGKRYVELRPAPGPALGPDQFPPNWPPAGVE